MTKDVLVSISGLQYEVDQEDAVEVITVGEYYLKNDKHYILYDELSEEGEGVTKNTIKISDKQVDIMKRGVNNVHMVFQPHTQNMTYYNTPFGELVIQVSTTDLKVIEEDKILTAHIEYDLSVNYTHVSECAIDIKIMAKGASK